MTDLVAFSLTGAKECVRKFLTLWVYVDNGASPLVMLT